MTFDLPVLVLVPTPSDTVPLDLYDVTCTAAATPEALAVTLVVEHKFDLAPGGAFDPRQVGEVQVFANGFHVSGNQGTFDPPQVHSRAVDGRRVTLVFTVPRERFSDLIPAGECRLSVMVRDSGSLEENKAAVIGYLERAEVLPPRPVPSLTGGVLRALFWADPEELAADPAAVQALEDAGVNCLTCGVFLSPGDNPARDTLAKFQADTNQLILPRLQWCRANNFRLLATLDDALRNQAERDWLTTCPWAHDAVVWVAQLLGSFADVVVGIEVFDEAPDVTGDPVCLALVGWLREGWPAVKLTWPNQYPTAAANEIPALSNYASRYLTLGGIGFETTASLGEFAEAFGRAATAVDRSRPWLCQVGAMGAFYTKRAEGGDYQAGVDELQKGGVRGLTIPAQAWLALAHGASGLRCYAYDAAFARNGRAAAPIGSPNLETGVRPGDDRWDGLSAGFKSVAAREAKLLVGFRPPVAEGQFVYGVRDELSWAVNVSERDGFLPGGGRLVTPAGEAPYAGGPVPAGGVVIWE